ncbi:MAG: pyridoxal-phosphate dependent enzyme, partial [candidate division Zixibacteria bacterium]|nr:pyridoxal-phosphate dependent enzyme [candidate division Zixibacteria bacterium]
MAIQWDSFKTITDHIFDTIGRTPLLRLNRISELSGINCEILGKMEYFSPSGSLKDRIYMNMFNLAEERNQLRPGMTVLECSTGNAGISCSFVAAVKGYPCIIVMPEGMSEERKMLDMAYGAQMVYTPGGESDVDLALQKVEEIRTQDPDKYWVPAQFDNSDNIDAHYQTTGPEIWEQTNGEFDVFIATQGTGGTITGAGRYFRERNPDVKLFAIEPAECPLLSERNWGPHGIEGIGDGFVPLNLDVSILNGII